jgi:hypothetical protein
MARIVVRRGAGRKAGSRESEGARRAAAQASFGSIASKRAFSVAFR